ncbi:holin [Arthrobacter phage Whytu]|uniref:Holin n=1 Tax=Arthrobacter phage Whytu TaxID=2713260 RepID=A0A6G8R2R7_9CAUD|nr:holin [Arthrobacter phage Whytu]QIN94482.1 holin [Arthrobacter phage Whytu]
MKHEAAPAPVNPARFIPSPKVRAYVYSLLIAAGPVVVFYGLMSREEVALWIGFGGTVLSPAGILALANTPKGSRHDTADG